MKIICRSILLFFLLLQFMLAKAQELPSTDFYTSIKKYDLGKLWHADQIQTEGNGDKIPFPEPLGFIGDNFQRFYIHYLLLLKAKKSHTYITCWAKQK